MRWPTSKDGFEGAHSWFSETPEKMFARLLDPAAASGGTTTAIAPKS